MLPSGSTVACGRKGRYISYRWNTYQFPRKFQAVQECTGGYIPGKPVVSAPLYCRKYMYMYVCIIILCMNFCSHTLFVPPVYTGSRLHANAI